MRLKSRRGTKREPGTDLRASALSAGKKTSRTALYPSDTCIYFNHPLPAVTRGHREQPAAQRGRFNHEIQIVPFHSVSSVSSVPSVVYRCFLG